MMKQSNAAAVSSLKLYLRQLMELFHSQRILTVQWKERKQKNLLFKGNIGFPQAGSDLSLFFPRNFKVHVLYNCMDACVFNIFLSNLYVTVIQTAAA